MGLFFSHYNLNRITQFMKHSQATLGVGSARWKWMAGATAAVATTAAQTNQVTVTISNDALTYQTGNELHTDLNGNGHADVTFSDIHLSQVSGGSPRLRFSVNIDGVHAEALFDSTSGGPHGFVQASANDGKSGFDSLTGTIPITFSGDPAVNNGATISATLTVNAANNYGQSPFGVTLVSYTYTAVPEPTTLGLLAMGVAGVLAFRRRKKQ
jgi:PEP-CTERM motif